MTLPLLHALREHPMATSSCFHGRQTDSSQTTECSHHVAETPLTLCWQQTVAVSLVSFTHTCTYTYPPHTPSSSHMHPHPHTPSSSHTIILTHHHPHTCTLILIHHHPHTIILTPSSSHMHPHPHTPSSSHAIILTCHHPHTYPLNCEYAQEN